MQPAPVYALDVRTLQGMGIYQPSPAVSTALYGISVLSAAVSGYHGYKRNQSVGWGVGWFVLGGLFPILVPVIAVAQGYAKPAKK